MGDEESPASLEEEEPHVNDAPKIESELTFKDRLQSFTWANFTCTQSTGGVAILLSQTPHRFTHLSTIGAVIFIFNLCLFILFTALISARFLSRRGSFTRSLTTPPEAYFAGSYWLTIATIIVCIDKYGVPHTGEWLITCVRVLFWIYAATSWLYNTIVFVVMFAQKPLGPDTFLPPMFLMVFTAMLAGTVAGSIAENQAPRDRLPIIVAGIAYQGWGWIASMLLLSRFIGSMFVNGLGPADMRPGLFMSVGSAGYTIVSVMACAKALPDGYAYFEKHPQAAEILRVTALWFGIFLWLFTFWLFSIAFIATLPLMFPRVRRRGGLQIQPRMKFTLPWWAFIFPNVGFTIGTIFIGQELESEGILWVSTAMTVVIVVVWIMDLGLQAKYMLRGKFM